METLEIFGFARNSGPNLAMPIMINGSITIPITAMFFQRAIFSILPLPVRHCRDAIERPNSMLL